MASCRVLIYLCIAISIIGCGVLMPVMLSLYLSPSRPSISIDLFDNQAAFNMNLTIIHFHLKIKNENSAIGLHYPDPLKVTFSYFPNVSMMVTLAEYKVDSFYQGNGKTKHVRDLVETNGVPTVLLEGTDLLAFRVDLVGTFKYKMARSKRHKMDLGCVVGVDYTTSQKFRTGFIRFAEPGHDSQLKPRIRSKYGGPGY